MRCEDIVWCGVGCGSEVRCGVGVWKCNVVWCVVWGCVVSCSVAY